MHNRLRPSLRRSRTPPVFDAAFLVQLTAVVLFVVLFCSSTAVNSIFWDAIIGLVVSCLWLVHIALRLRTDPMFKCLRAPPITPEEAQEAANRWKSFVPLIELSMKGNITKHESGRFFRSLKWSRWENKTSLSDIEWPPGVALVSVFEDVQAGDGHTRTRFEVQVAKFQADCRRQYGKVTSRWKTERHLTCSTFDEPRHMKVARRTDKVSIFLSPTLYLLTTALGLSFIWGLCISIWANRMDLVVIKHVYIDQGRDGHSSSSGSQTTTRLGTNSHV
ncbi:Uncharacterized protein PBTT_02878 [Plasmodiophora brassicae]|uniref:Uncharacterized protein n=1 Tax=Plasmodiophora brassicae TaxID=37360 RepID=A0A0G4J805_PLABS|nr:hypothetical protein PBRA_003186 [Plasmodiophora brassicae]SPQ95658.1 unnamed protein product [Plasmodiophora brassicae]